MTNFTNLAGAPVSRFAFGTMQWGGTSDDAMARETWDASCAAGISHFDTAHAYTDGASETMLGSLVRATDRDTIFVATKAAYTGGASRQNILSSVDTSRRRMQLDVIDLLYMHRWDAETPLEETFDTLSALQHNGTIRYIGVSNYAAWQVMKAQGIAATFGTRIDAVQPMLNLVKRQAEVELLPMAADQDITVCSYSPLGGGLLTGKYRTNAPSGAGSTGRLDTDTRYAARYGQDWMSRAAEELAVIAERVGTHPATLAVAWLREHAPEVCPILSARNGAQLSASIDGMTHEIGADLLAELTALTPTPPPATDRTEEA